MKDTDLGSDFRKLQQGGVRIGARVQTDSGMVVHNGAVAVAECVLDALNEKGLLNGTQGAKADRVAVGRSRYEQGIWLRKTFMRAGLQPVKAFDPNRPGGVSELSDEAETARKRYNQTIRSIGAKAEIVAAFVCYDNYPGDKQVKWLCEGLDLLCEFRGA